MCRACKPPRRNVLGIVLFRYFQGLERICSMEQAAEAVGLGKDTLYRAQAGAGDLGADTIIAMDILVSSLTGQPRTPFADSLRSAAISEASGQSLDATGLCHVGLDLQQRLGVLAAEIRQATSDGVLTGPELAANMKAALSLQDAIGALVRDLRATAKPSRGRCPHSNKPRCAA